MRTSRLLTVAAVLTSYAWVLAGGCSASGDKGPANGGGSGSGAMMDASNDATKIMPDAMGLGGNGGNQLNPLCGNVEEQCVPDDEQACGDFRPPTIKPPSSSGGAGGEDGLGGAANAGESAGGAAGESSGVGGESGDGVGGAATGGVASGGAAAGGEAGNAGNGSVEPPGPAKYGCQVTRVGNLVERSCQLAGEGELNAPCFSAGDCQAGLACVSEGEAGRCLRYCCEGDDACGKGTYCAEQPLRKPTSDTSNTEPPRVPVCVPADDCSLEETFPCPAGTECRCQGNTACLVVRADGTTTCRTPGTGQQGEACPCAWNHVCSSVTQKCVKICNTDPAKDDCGEQKCQASSELPPNFGVCVGPVK